MDRAFGKTPTMSFEMKQPPFLEEKRKNERKNKKRENKITKPICVTALVKLHSVFAL